MTKGEEDVVAGMESKVRLNEMTKINNWNVSKSVNKLLCVKNDSSVSKRHRRVIMCLSHCKYGKLESIGAAL